MRQVSVLYTLSTGLPGHIVMSPEFRPESLPAGVERYTLRIEDPENGVDVWEKHYIGVVYTPDDVIALYPGCEGKMGAFKFYGVQQVVRTPSGQYFALNDGDKVHRPDDNLLAEYKMSPRN